MYIFTKQNPIVVALAATLGTMLVASVFYLSFEPSSLFATQHTNTFTVQQDVGAEISFATLAADFTMAGTAVGGTTGGTRNGSTTVGVTTNNSAGYYMTIQFTDATGMVKADGSDRISYYATSTPDYNMALGTATTAMAYSVSSTAAVTNFLNNGSACNQALGDSSYEQCFMVQGNPDSSPETLVNSASAVTNELTIVSFRVMVAAGSGLTNGSYYATTTLTAITN